MFDICSGSYARELTGYAATHAVVRARLAGRLRRDHSAMARLMTQAAPISSAFSSSFGLPRISAPTIPVSICVAAPSPIAYARVIQARWRIISPRRMAIKP